MKPNFWLSCLFFSLLLFQSKAQDQTNFTQFYLNPYLVNPSFAGIDGQSAFSLFYRKQWANIDGGPAIANISLQTPLTVNTGVGISITNDKKGLLNNSGLLLSLSYNLPLSEHNFFRFGLSAGGSWNTVDLDRLPRTTTPDPAITTLLNKNASINGNAGVSLHLKFFHLGISMPTIFTPSYVSKDAFSITEVKPFQSLIFQTSYRFYFADNKNIFEPYAIYRMNTGLPSQFEFAGILHLNHTIWLGGTYKQDFGISAVGGVKLKQFFAIGGAYSIQNSGINQLNSPSFEINLSYLIGKKKRGAHAYSFVNTEREKEKKRPTASDAVAAARKQEELNKKNQLEASNKQKAAEAARVQQEKQALAKAEAEKKKAAAANATKPPVKTETVVKKDPVVTPPKKDPVVTPPVKKDVVVTQNTPKKDSVPPGHVGRPRFGQEMDVKTPDTEVTHEQEQEILKRLETHADNPTEHHGDDPNVHPNAERHEFVKRGNHAQELDVADYVVGGVFKADVNAKHFADGLVKLGFKADYGHLTEKALWYVYLIQTDDLDKARAERDRVRKMKLLKDAWLLTVHH
jgi:type IX secretion system PorP/SprF family membrane protein